MSLMMRCAGAASDASREVLSTLVDGFHLLCVFSAGHRSGAHHCAVHHWSWTLHLCCYYGLCPCPEKKTKKGETLYIVLLYIEKLDR